MVLNETSYVHTKIRQLCLQLELFTGAVLITNLSENFEKIQFKSKFGYIIIDYKEQTILSLSNHIGKSELGTIEDIMLYCKWLEMGEKYAKNRCNKNVTFIFKKTIDNRKCNVYTRK